MRATRGSRLSSPSSIPSCAIAAGSFYFSWRELPEEEASPARSANAREAASLSRCFLRSSSGVCAGERFFRTLSLYSLYFLLSVFIVSAATSGVFDVLVAASVLPAGIFKMSPIGRGGAMGRRQSNERGNVVIKAKHESIHAAVVYHIWLVPSFLPRFCRYLLISSFSISFILYFLLCLFIFSFCFLFIPMAGSKQIIEML